MERGFTRIKKTPDRIRENPLNLRSMFHAFKKSVFGYFSHRGNKVSDVTYS